MIELFGKVTIYMTISIEEGKNVILLTCNKVVICNCYFRCNQKLGEICKLD